MSDRGTEPQRRTPRWRYVVPNAITCMGLLLGLTATFRAMEGDYTESAWLIVLCVLIDKLDGTAARLLRATSSIGVQLDSFSDFVTFGIAPGSLVFMTTFHNPDGHFPMWQGTAMGWVMRVLVAAYVLCACIRLAKFNVLTEESGGANVFYGMPTTFAGGLVAVAFILGVTYQRWDLLAWAPAVMAVLGALMVSNLPIPKIAPRQSPWANGFQLVNVAMGYICGIFRIWPEYLFAVILLYGTGGFIWGWIHRHELAPKRLDPYPQ